MIDSVDVSDPLDVVAGKIRVLWKKSEDQRLAAALLLKEAKERVEAGEDPNFVSFASWCRVYLPERSKREIRKLLQIATAPDPKAALDKIRTDTREQTRRWRARAASREATFRDEMACGPSCSAANDAVWDCKRNGNPTKGGEEVDAVVEIDNSVAGTETGEHRRADVITEPGDGETFVKANELSETHEPEQPQQSMIPIGLQIVPDIDPYNDREPLWVRGGIQLIAFIASALPHIQNKEQITGLVLQLINALVPTLLETAMPEEKRGKIVSLLRFCGYKDFADQLLACWAEADAAIARAEIQVCPHQSSSRR